MAQNSSFKSYLPGTTYVMAKKKKIALVTDARADASEILFIEAEGALLESSFPSALNEESIKLFQKMMSAMGLKTSQARICQLKEMPLSLTTFPPPENIKVVVALGETTAKQILNSSDTLETLREKTHSFQSGQKLIVTFHPQFLLTNPGVKKAAWEDLKKAMKYLD